jgi:hypothetical protein
MSGASGDGTGGEGTRGDERGDGAAELLAGAAQASRPDASLRQPITESNQPDTDEPMTSELPDFTSPTTEVPTEVI